MIVVIDNYDSFTYNLVQYLGELGQVVKVFRNDAVTVDQLYDLKPDYIVISPGPGRPENAGITKEIIQRFHQTIPILGVCLGHQAIAEVFGAKIINAPYLMHGKTSPVYHDGRTVFENLQSPFKATRYHSLIVDRKTLSAEFNISAWTEDDIIMGIRHKDYPLEGIQFHPESILTESGKQVLSNFLNKSL